MNYGLQIEPVNPELEIRNTQPKADEPMAQK